MQPLANMWDDFSLLDADGNASFCIPDDNPLTIDEFDFSMPLLSYDQLISSEFDNDGIFQVDSEIVDPSTCPEIGPDSSASGSEIQALKDCV